jgi:hypothetical protein
MVIFEMSQLGHQCVAVNDFICSFPNFCRVWSLNSQEIFLTLLLWLWLSPWLLVVAGWQLQPLVVKGGVRQKGPAGDPAWSTSHMTVFCVEAEIGLASSTPDTSEGVTEEL